MKPCCDLHNHNCEPPSELCCHQCTEALHPEHYPSAPCILTICDCQKCIPKLECFTDLTEDERRHLAITASNLGHNCLDFRYHQHLTQEQRQQQAERWQKIADALAPNLWGEAA